MKSPLLLALAVSLSVACATTPPPPAASSDTKATSATVTPIEPVDGPRAHELVKSGARLVDVRSPGEYAEKHIDGAINVPVDQIDAQDVGDKDKPVVLYCRGGKRAQRAAEALHAKGFTKVYVLGAMSNWESGSAAPPAPPAPPAK